MMNSLICVALVICIIIFVVMYLLTKGNQKQIPGPKPIDSMTGNFPDIKRAGSLHQFLMSLHKTYGPIASFWWGPKLTVSIASPQLFKEHSKPFDRPVELFEMFSPLFGSGALTFVNGPEGIRRHIAYARCFTTAAMNIHYELFNKISRALVCDWRRLPVGEHIPLRQCMLAFGIETMLRGCFGDFFSDSTKIHQLRKAYDFAWSTLEERLKSDVSEMSSSKQNHFDEQIKILRGTMLECMTYRRQNPPTAAEYLVIDAVLELDMDEEATQSDLVTIFVAGFQTSAFTLVWGMYFLASQLDIQDKVQEELTRVLGNETIDADKLNELRYLQQVIDETLRCSVLAPFAARVQGCDVNLGGHKIPAGTPVLHAIGVASQNPSIYQEPTKFDPERFNPENIRNRPNYSFTPFGFAGKRICPGYRFAQVEACVLLAEILRTFKVSLVEGQMITPEHGLVTMPKDEVWVTIKERRD